MKKGSVFTLLFAVVLIAGCAKTVPVEQYETKAKEVEALTAQIDKLQAQAKALTGEVDALKTEKESLLKDKEELQTKTSELSQKAEKAEQLEKATQTYQDLTKKLEKEIQQGQVQITEMKNRLTMTMVDKIIFPSGSADISKDGEKVLDKVISILKDVKDKRIQVEGHTDNVPIVSKLKERFPTN